MQSTTRQNTRSKIMVKHEVALQRAVLIFIISGIVFMLLPGTFPGVWNLISLSAEDALESSDQHGIVCHPAADQTSRASPPHS